MPSNKNAWIRYRALDACFRNTHMEIHAQAACVCRGSYIYTNGIEEELFKVGFCLPAGPYVTDEDVRYIVESIREAIVG